MKTRTWSFVLLSGLLGVGACCLWWPAAEMKKTTAKPARPPAEPVKPAVVKARPTATPADEARRREREEKMAKSKERLAALEKQTKDLMVRVAKSAEKITPEMQQKMVEGYMKAHEPHYRDLFDSWNLDPGTQQQVLDIIRERETQRNSGIVRSMKSGDMTAGRKERENTMNTAEGQLLFLLGQDHLDQISTVDKQMQDEALAKIQERVKANGQLGGGN